MTEIDVDEENVSVKESEFEMVQDKLSTMMTYFTVLMTSTGCIISIVVFSLVALLYKRCSLPRPTDADNAGAGHDDRRRFRPVSSYWGGNRPLSGFSTGFNFSALQLPSLFSTAPATDRLQADLGSFRYCLTWTTAFFVTHCIRQKFMQAKHK